MPRERKKEIFGVDAPREIKREMRWRCVRDRMQDGVEMPKRERE